MIPFPRQFAGLSLIAALAVSGGPVAAARQDVVAALSPEADGVSQLVTAMELVAWARARGDTDGLRTAARMIEEVPLRQSGAGDPGLGPIVSAAALYLEANRLDGVVDEVVVTGHRSRRETEAREGWVERTQPPPRRWSAFS
ncbi:MAG: hypothetical protein EON89_15420, partial [Brevundimonas sp.]